MTNNIFASFPEIDLGAIRLRELDNMDAGDFLDFINHKEVTKFMSDEDIPKNYSQALREVEYWSGLFRFRNSFYWGIANDTDNKLIGTCGYNYWNKDHRRAELSYDLACPFWNKGIMTSVLQQVLKFGFSKMLLNRISANVSPDNKGSIRVLEKLGFSYEGNMRQYKLVHGEFHDAHVYSIIRDDYKAT